MASLPATSLPAEVLVDPTQQVDAWSYRSLVSSRSQFAPVETRTAPRPPLTAQVRIGDEEDARRAARLTVTVVTHAGTREDWEQRLIRDVSGPDRTLVVAIADGEVVGYTRLGLVESDAPAPDGFYLLGLVVAAAHRRRGIAEALVGLAAQEACRRTDVLWSYYDVENGASAALHARLGFVERARGAIGFPGLAADRHDVLVSLALQGHASAERE